MCLTCLYKSLSLIPPIYVAVWFCIFSNNTLWGSLEEPDIVNTNEFEDLFSKAALQQKKKPLSDTFEKKSKTKKVDSLGWLISQL